MSPAPAAPGGAGRRRVLVLGAGALGSVYGACLARGGAAVTLLAREPHARAVREQGGVGVVEEGGRRWLAPLDAEWRPERLGRHDVIMLLTKAHDSQAALAGASQLVDGVELAVSLQNGVDKDRVLAEWCGAERVIGGMSMVGASLEQPGTVSWTLPGTTYVGELPSGASERSRWLVSRLQAGGMQAVLCQSMLAAEWAKLVHAAPVMTLTALSRRPLHEVLLAPELSRHYVDAVREGIAVARAAGVEVPDFPGLFPVASIAQAPLERALELVRERGAQLAASGRTHVRVSMLVDLERGRPLELDAVHGFLVSEADRLGVAVPVTRHDLTRLGQLQRRAAAPA